VYTAFCNPKGRVLADALAIIISDDTVLLRGRKPVMEALSAHLTPFLAFSKSALKATQWTVVGSGPSSGLQTEPVSAQLIEENDAVTAVVINRGKGFIEYWQGDASVIQPDPEDVVPLARVDFETARARVESSTIGAYLPQDLNYDLNETVNFTKGCYTGQEIVARLHYRGTPKRRLYRAIIANISETPTPGDGITNAEGQRVGSIVNTLPVGEQLGVLIEVTPDSTHGPLLTREQGQALSSLEACHPVTDQSMG
jgi:folate-binding protein YgfZ